MSNYTPEKFTAAIDKFILQSKGELFIEGENTQEMLKDLSMVLGISRIDVSRVEYAIECGKQETFNQTYFRLSSIDINRKFEVVIEEKNIIKVTYSYFQIPGDDDWNDETKNHLNMISNIMYLYSKVFYLNKFIEYGATHDHRFPLIHNHNFLIDRMNKLIENNKISEYGIAFFNIHNFNRVNRVFGETAGNEVLKNYFQWLKNLVEGKSPEESKGVVCALGGDNGIVLYKKELETEIMRFFDKTEISINHNGETESIFLSSHAGMNSKLTSEMTAHTIIGTVIATLTLAKRNNTSSIIFYDSKFKKSNEQKIFIEKIYKEALTNEEFMVYYQPKVDLRDYRLRGAEALVRWRHEGTMIFPDDFIPILEQNQQIKYLDIYMLNHVCRDIKEWLRQGKEVPQISINLSRASLGIPDLAGFISNTINTYEIPRQLIQIELTESAKDASNEELRPLVEGLNMQGIGTAVDDFGTGYSSLSLIQELPWDVIKIDKHLLRVAQKTGSREQKMFKAIISMANLIGLEPIVEGVESREDIKLLKESGCFLAQGFYFSKPIPKDDFTKLLNKSEAETE